MATSTHIRRIACGGKIEPCMMAHMLVLTSTEISGKLEKTKSIQNYEVSSTPNEKNNFVLVYTGSGAFT